MANDPITREEMLLNAVATGVSSGIEPITREEMYLAYIGGQDVIPPEPITRKEQFLSRIAPGGGSGVIIRNQNKTITENGTYTADTGYTGLGEVIVDVPIPDVGEGGIGEGVYYSDLGQMYTPHMVIPNIPDMRYVRDHFKNADKLVTFKQQYGSATLDSDYGIFRGCTALEEVWVSRPTYGQYFFQGCSSLKTVTLGRVGLAVTAIEMMWAVDPSVNRVETITCYVNAETLADIPASVADNIVPAFSPNASIIYRNSTTGEVISE